MSYLLIGLGNPNKKFDLTRHNAGKMFAGWLNKEQGTGNKKQWDFDAVETDCLMNASGDWVNNHYKNYKDYKNLYIIHDDLDIPLGTFKIQFGKGPRRHKGILSVEQALGTKEFWRVRIGVDGRQKEEGRRKKEEGEDYVLEKFRAEEKKILESVFPEIGDRLNSLSFLRKQESI
ncbi:aminoacyl-tRNA hydrolase [Candidatus Collierbacteria bacterium]|nr:aminoacyl-tRNA hydrolase [Candidatus Collierbacteria bacterium]